LVAIFCIPSSAHFWSAAAAASTNIGTHVINKQYSRNLNRRGKGIELFAVHEKKRGLMLLKL